jgi:hypothetical protein
MTKVRSSESTTIGLLFDQSAQKGRELFAILRAGKAPAEL